MAASPASRSAGATLRIGMDMTFPSRNSGGVGNYAHSLVEAMRDIPNVNVVTLQAPAAGLANTLRWLASGSHRAIARARVDVHHCPAFVTPYRSPAPLVITIHDTSPGRFPRDHPLEWRLYHRWLLPERARRAVRVITDSESARRRLLHDYRIPEDSVVAIHLGVADRFFAAGAGKAQSSQERVLLFPGAPIQRKNLDLVLAALEGAPRGSALSKARLWISGCEAERFPRYVAGIARAGLADRVNWLGSVPDVQLPALYRQADLVVYPSHEEGFGLPPLEAMAAGTPVLASNTECLVEVLGDDALLVGPNDVAAFIAAAEGVLTRRELGANLSERGYLRARTYTWARCAEQTHAVYMEVLSGKVAT